MDGDRFDDITRALAAGRSGTTSRRRFLASLAGGALAAAGLLPRRQAEAQQVTQAYCGNVTCGKNPGKCKSGCVCCSYSNNNSRCRPPGTCGPGEEIAPATTTTTTTPAPCVPATACPAGVECGTAPNGCGGEIPCGECTPPETCGGGGTAGVCGCTDDGQACAGRECGTAVNNCGAVVNCGPLAGACPPGQTCSGAGACACPPGTCGEACALVVCPDSSCKQGATGACAADGDCCSGVCVGGVCQGGCVAEGGVCDSGPDCCAGACVTPGTGGAQRCCASGKACSSQCCTDATQVCDPSGACCTPNTCQPGQCGTHPDGCGRGLDCGGCTVPGETCGGGGTPGVCGSCTSADSAVTCAGKCGTVLDNCGREVDCSGCGGGLTCCNGACVDLSSDVDNCRECGKACFRNPETCTTATCQGGVCVSATVFNCCQGDDDCLDADPCTVSTCDPQTLTCRHDPIECGSGETCCNGACVNLTNDSDNCGTCGNTCVENQPCGPCPPGQLCPDTGPGCCETGSCSAGRCASSRSICGSCATPLCDPDLGSICVSNCPPPDACHTGDGACQLDGTCVYEPKCSSCQECDPSTGTCSASPCGILEFCVDGECVPGLVCLDLVGPDGTLCHPTDTCEIVTHTPLPETGCCPADAVRCPLHSGYGGYDLCCPAGDTCETQMMGEPISYCSSVGPLCPPLSSESTFTSCPTSQTCAVTLDLSTGSVEPVCCPADGVVCGDGTAYGRPLCCPAGDTCGTVEFLGMTFPACSSSGNYCPGANSSPVIMCGPNDTCAFTKFSLGETEVGCCPPDGVLCRMELPSFPGGPPDLPGGVIPEVPVVELCCPAGDTCTLAFSDGIPFPYPRCSSAGGACPTASGIQTCQPGETCAVMTYDPGTQELELGCCPATGVICSLEGAEGVPDLPFLSVCCPAGDTCELTNGPGSFPRCSSSPN